MKKCTQYLGWLSAWFVLRHTLASVEPGMLLFQIMAINQLAEGGLKKHLKDDQAELFFPTLVVKAVFYI